MSQSLEEDLVERVIRFIERLGYDGLETLEPSWVRSVLVNAGPARHNFMVWVVSQLCPSDMVDLQSAPQQTHSQRILQSLTSLGICKTGDSDLIEGTAPAVNQLRFWRACLEKVCQVRHISSKGYRHQRASVISDVLLDHLAHSPYLSQILKDSGANVIPGDLRERYRASYKNIKNVPLQDLLQETGEQAKELQKQYSAVDKKWKSVSPLLANNGEEKGEEQKKLCEAIACMNKQRDLFQGVYTSYIVPWTTATPQLDLPNTGEVVQEATAKLLNLTKVLKSMEEVSQRCSELAEQEKQMTKNINHPSTIMTMLQSIVSQESNVNKSGQVAKV